MKIYCIQLDAFPLKEELINFSKKYNFKLIKKFTTGIYTVPTIFSMLHGKNPSKLIKNGISYYGPEKDTENFFKFNKHNNNNLIKILNKKNYKCYIDNFYSYIKIPTGWMYYEKNNTLKLSDIKKKDNIIFKNIIYPDEYENINILSTPYNPGFIWSFQNYHNEEESNKFYKHIIENIKFIQSSNDKNIYYTLNIEDYHHIERTLKELNIDSDELINQILIRVLNVLEKINYDEPDSIFYIYADHGMGGNQYFDLENYYTWALVRDNTVSSQIIKPFISSCDYYSFILNKINYTCNENYCQDFYSKFDINRLYYLEDSRIYSSPINMNSIGIVKIIDYEQNIPKKILQMTYFKGICDSIQKIYIYIYELKNNKNYLFDYNFNKKLIFEGSINDIEPYIKINNNKNIKILYNSLIKNYNIKYMSKNKIILNGIRDFVIKNYQEPEQYTKNMDNKIIYRYKSRDESDYFRKVLKYIKQYNEKNI